MLTLFRIPYRSLFSFHVLILCVYLFLKVFANCKTGSMGYFTKSFIPLSDVFSLSIPLSGILRAGADRGTIALFYNIVNRAKRTMARAAKHPACYRSAHIQSVR